MRELQELLDYKFGKTPFRVWHYYVVLSVLYIVLPLLPGAWFQSTSSLIFLMFVLMGLSGLRQVVGNKLSRDGLDSVLIMRYFAAIPWVLLPIETAVILAVGHFDDLTTMFYRFFLWLGVGAMVFHLLGIIIHYKKRKLTYRNIKKEDLFQ